MSDKMPYFNGRVLFNGIAISYSYMICGSATFISCLFGTIIGVIFLLLLKNNCNSFSKTITSFILTFIVFTIVVNMGHSLYLNNTPVWVLTLIPGIAAFIISNSKDRALIKVSNILFFYSVFLFILEILGLYPSIELSNLLPLQINSKNIIWSSFVFAIISTTPIIALNDTSDKKNTIINYLISALTINTICFLAITVLGQKEVQLLRFPETVVLKRIEFLNFISSVDSFFNFAVIVDVLLTMSRGLKNIEEASNKVWKFIVLFVLILLTIWSCYNNWPLLLIYEYFPYILIILLIIAIIPIKSRYKNAE